MARTGMSEVVLAVTAIRFRFWKATHSVPPAPPPIPNAGGGFFFRRNDLYARRVMSSVWSAMVLVLAAVISAVWIGVLGFGLMHLIEQVF